MLEIPDELERQCRRFLNGRGDAAVSLVSFLGDSLTEQPFPAACAALVLSRIHIVKGSLDLASLFLRLSAGLFRQADTGELPLGLWVNKALILRNLGRRTDAEKLIRRVFDLSIKYRQPLAAAKAASNLSVLLSFRGDYGEARSYHAFALKSYSGMGKDEGLIRCSLAEAYIAMRSGKPAKAVDMIHQLGDEAKGIRDSRFRLMCILTMAEALIIAGETERAEYIIKEAELRGTDLERFPPLKLKGMLLRSRLEWLKGDRESADEILRGADLLRSRMKLCESSPVFYENGNCSNIQECRENSSKRREGTVFITSNARTRVLLEEIKSAAVIPVPVLITGESGTGKELVARLIHRWSGKGDMPFLPMNVAAISSELFESTLFGHARGAFTGALSRNPGIFKVAEGGTVFLDEIGELPVRMQAKLLRFLDSGEYIPVGANRVISGDVRVIAATNRNLEDMVEKGAFRRDLYFRLSALNFHIPPLRERMEDIETICSDYLEKIRVEYGLGKIEPGEAVRSALNAYGWPGNVRELKNELLTAAIRRRSGILRLIDLSPRFLTAERNEDSNGSGSLEERLRDMERRELLEAIRASGGNITAAARALGMKRTTLIYRLRRLGLYG